MKEQSKTSFSVREYLAQEPEESIIRKKDGGKYIPIGPLEDLLDFFEWGTRNFTWELYKNGTCVAASIELVLNFEMDDGQRMTRCFVGACNFPLDALGRIPDFLATAKSMCVKNAAMDAGRKLGRWLNDGDVVPDRAGRIVESRSEVKMKPDLKIKQQMATAAINNDTEMMKMLSDIYEFNTPGEDA